MKTLYFLIIIMMGMVLVIGNSQLSFAQDVIYGTGEKTYHILVSPLKQFKSGIASKDIKCAPDLQLVIKTKNHTPACIKPEDVSKLVERGWADKPNSLQEQLDMANSCIGSTDACRHSYDTKNMTKENQTGVSVTQTIPSCVSNISHQYAIAGFPGDLMCPVMNVEDSGKIQSTSGFYGIYNYTKYPGTLNFILEPGHNGTITYLVSVDAIYNYSGVSQYTNGVNIENGVEFMHDAGMNNHPGVDVLSNPPSELIENHKSALVTIVFSASNSAPPGTYWVTFPPGVCTGGQVIILTIAECTK